MPPSASQIYWISSHVSLLFYKYFIVLTVLDLVSISFIRTCLFIFYWCAWYLKIFFTIFKCELFNRICPLVLSLSCSTYLNLYCLFFTMILYLRKIFNKIDLLVVRLSCSFLTFYGCLGLTLNSRLKNFR